MITKKMKEMLALQYDSAAWNGGGCPAIVMAGDGNFFCGYNLTKEMIDGDEHSNYAVYKWDAQKEDWI